LSLARVFRSVAEVQIRSIHLVRSAGIAAARTVPGLLSCVMDRAEAVMLRDLKPLPYGRGSVGTGTRALCYRAATIRERSQCPSIALALLLAAGLAHAAVPTPASHFGHEIGADKTVLDWDKVVSWFRLLEKSSDRIKVAEL